MGSVCQGADMRPDGRGWGWCSSPEAFGRARGFSEVDRCKKRRPGRSIAGPSELGHLDEGVCGWGCMERRSSLDPV